MSKIKRMSEFESLNAVKEYYRIPIINESEISSWNGMLDNVNNYVNAEYNPKGKKTFALKANTDSMFCEGSQNSILPNDYIICDTTLAPSNADVVLVTSENRTKASIKEFYRENGKIILKSLNKKYSDIVINKNDNTGFYIEAVVTEIIKKLKRD